MSVLQVLDIGLAILVLAVAGWTIVAREIFGAVVGYVAYGLLLSIVWVRLYAPDVALTEAAVGSGVTGVLLVTAAARLGGAGKAAVGEPLALTPRLCAVVLSVLVAAALAAVVLLPPEHGPTLAPEARRGARRNRSRKSGHRGPDRLSLFRHDAREDHAPSGGRRRMVGRSRPVLGRGSRRPRPGEAGGRIAILRPNVGAARDPRRPSHLWVGADRPGGASQGGAILAAMWMIVMMARLADPPRVGAAWLRLALVAGPAVFFAAGLAGIGMAGSFFAYPAGFAKPIILFIEAFMVLSIAATLPMLVAGPPRRSPEP